VLSPEVLESKKDENGTVFKDVRGVLGRLI